MSDSSTPQQWFYLKRIQTNEKSHLIIPFKKEEVKIGRGKQCDYIILDEHLSRYHVVFKKSGNSWTVRNLSINGVFLNDVKIPKDEERCILVGDLVQIGPLKTLLFRFGLKEKGKVHQIQEPVQAEGTQQHIPGTDVFEDERKKLISQKAALEERLKESEALKERLLQEKEHGLSTMKAECDALQISFSEKQRELERKLSEGEMAQQNALETRETLAQSLKNEMEELQRKHEDEKMALEQNLRTEEETKANIVHETEQLALKLQTENARLERQLIEEREVLEGKLSEERGKLQTKLMTLEEKRLQLEKDVQERDQSLKLKLEEQEKLKEQQQQEAQRLKEEREQLASRLKEVESNLEEKVLLTSTLAGELEDKNEMKKRLEDLVHDKQSLEFMLTEAMKKGDQVDSLRSELELLEAKKLSLMFTMDSAEDASKAAEQQVVEKVSSVLDNELQCAICNELFITAIMLNCSHTFCKFCIDSWKKNKKDCPNCRSPISSETRSIVVDNFIEKIVSALSDDMKKERSALVQERKDAVAAAQAKAAAEAEAAAAARASRRGRGGRQQRGRNRGRGSVGTRGRTRSAATTRSHNPQQHHHQQQQQQQQQPPVVITLPGPSAALPLPLISPDQPILVGSSNESSSEDGSYDSHSSSEDGEPGYYYGGYGRCFNCGRRGHWEPGCPYR